MISQNSGEATILPYKKAASEAFAFNDVVTRDASGYITKATAATPRGRILGLIQRTVVSTDDDYADNSEVAVLIPDEDGEFVADVSTGSAVQAMVGKAYDLEDHNSLDVTTSNRKHFEITRVISTTQVKGKFIVEGDASRLVSFSQTVSYADFTDGGGAAGTLSLNCSIPAGAVYAQTLVTALTGFTGDTSAALTVGDGTDVDRYNTGTPSVFTTAAAGIDAGVPSGTKFHSAAKTPVLTVTSNADFTSVTAGAMTVHLFWYEAVA